jgi:hypothetical protein
VVASNEVFHEEESVFEGLVAAHKAGIETLVAWEGVRGLSAVYSLVFARVFELDIGLA